MALIQHLLRRSAKECCGAKKRWIHTTKWRFKVKRILFPVCCMLVFALTGCKKNNNKGPIDQFEKKSKSKVSADIDAAILKNFGALPAVMEGKGIKLTKEKIALGRMLYFDKRLSKNHDVSCNSCHGLSTFGVDNKPTSEGHKKQKGDRNSPTVYNAAGHFVQFWDGRSPSIEHQATQPIQNPVEMAIDPKRAVATVKSIPAYVEMFKKVFPGEKDPVTMDNIGKAIGAFERKLVTPSRWDKFLKGDKKALTKEEKLGLKEFVSAGCTTCHSGTYVGGHMYHKLGLIKPWPGNKDEGRFKVTKKAEDKFMFKVPSLRNIEKTGPYLHDGSVKSLEKMVKLMARHQLAKELKKEQVARIVTWLKTLTGTIPAEYIKEPKLPASTDKTPKADPT